MAVTMFTFVVVKNYVIDKSEADTMRFYLFILSRRSPLVMFQHSPKSLATNDFLRINFLGLFLGNAAS